MNSTFLFSLVSSQSTPSFTFTLFFHVFSEEDDGINETLIKLALMAVGKKGQCLEWRCVVPRIAESFFPAVYLFAHNRIMKQDNNVVMMM